MATTKNKRRTTAISTGAMKFRLEAFWLILLTVGGNQKQLATDCCYGRPTWGIPAATATSTAATLATAAAEQKSIGNELENATKLRETAEQTKRLPPVVGDITTTVWPQTGPDATTFTAKSFAHLAIKQAKGHSLDLDIKQRVAKLLASGESDSSAAAAAEAGQTVTTTMSDSDGSESSGTSTRHPERRHVVPDKLQYTKEIQIKQGRLMGITRRFQVTSGLGEVDQYLGIPYAEAPIGSRRFMPPGEYPARMLTSLSAVFLLTLNKLLK